jgi:hypothetical protein
MAAIQGGEIRWKKQAFYCVSPFLANQVSNEDSG